MPGSTASDGAASASNDWPPICRSTGLLDRPAGKLSSGQKTRVAIAKALLNEPELLLLDEPTASLDPDTGDWVRGYLEDYRDRTGATILLASHNMAEVERLCSEVMMMKEGRIVDRGSPEELIDRYGRANLEEVFLHIAREHAQPGAGRMSPADSAEPLSPPVERGRRSMIGRIATALQHRTRPHPPPEAETAE